MKSPRGRTLQHPAYVSFKHVSSSLRAGVDARTSLQHWLQGASIPETSAQKIFSAADRILKAGDEGY